jgi:arabinogalactan oligomer / maltooligosaccharide transport system permease protein
VSRRATVPRLVGAATLLGLAVAVAVWAAPPLVAARAWPALAVLAATTAGLAYLYLTRRHVPAKYLVPGPLLLVAAQACPVLYTVAVAFTNFGDGHRGTKAEAIAAVEAASLDRVPGSPDRRFTAATRGDPATGPLVLLLVAPDGTASVGDGAGLRPLPAATLDGDGGVAAAPGYTVLRPAQAVARAGEIARLTVPTREGAIRPWTLTSAYELRPHRRYDAGCDCVRDGRTGQVWRAGEGAFVDAGGEELPEGGWKVNVGFANLARVVTDPAISGPFLRTFAWTVAFAAGSVALTFGLGLACALALHSDRMRGRAAYRLLMVLPYAMPSFAMLLVWRDAFNADFGLVNRLFGLDVNWWAGDWTARAAVLAVQLWLGYPYMFLVITGALQAIPRELVEVARVDGAGPWRAFRAVTLPLVLAALGPVLIASFAYNFNNFNVIYLTTQGAPFPPDNPDAGATDLLITYTFRLAFGGGSQYGLAAAVSLVIFALVAAISVAGLRRLRAVEAYT